MILANYLGLNLKSDEVIELLDSLDMQVVYDFDRLHENTPDSYSSSSKSTGFELRFNETQVLETIWCYMQPRHGFTQIDSGSVGVPVYASFEMAQSAARELRIKTSEPREGKAWIRLELENVWHHYEFDDQGLALITLMLPWEK
ncbi:hypothetical protein [Pseudoduganella violaceinigra]|uniref:hypothetical protein n=1 Tax=Pseudoduganella violaceinigra TaxID=246602 RepID=UPI00041349DF|nr:hypothetical protein [Pseudoduganella violaceinigra]